MPLHAAFLRGINLGGRRIRMVELRAHVSAYGLKDVKTYRASGNVIFHPSNVDAADLERGIEAHLESALGGADWTRRKLTTVEGLVQKFGS